MYLHVGNNVMIPERRIIGIFDLEITSQSRITAAYLRNAEQESVVIDACEDIPKSFLVCDHPYHRQIVYLSQLNSRTLQGRVDEQENNPSVRRPADSSPASRGAKEEEPRNDDKHQSQHRDPDGQLQLVESQADDGKGGHKDQNADDQEDLLGIFL